MSYSAGYSRQGGCYFDAVAAKPGKTRVEQRLGGYARRFHQALYGLLDIFAANPRDLAKFAPLPALYGGEGTKGSVKQGRWRLWRFCPYGFQARPQSGNLLLSQPVGVRLCPGPPLSCEPGACQQQGLITAATGATRAQVGQTAVQPGHAAPPAGQLWVPVGRTDL